MIAAPRTLPAPLQWLKSCFRGRHKAASQPERRVNRRQRMRFEAEVQRLDGVFPVVGVDIHEDGAKVLSKQSWAMGTILFFNLKTVQLGGFAEVRHSTLRKDGRYAIGLAFRGRLIPQGATWQIQRVCQSEGAWTKKDDGLDASNPTPRPREVA